jgi:hypothetical protein
VPSLSFVYRNKAQEAFAMCVEFVWWWTVEHALEAEFTDADAELMAWAAAAVNIPSIDIFFDPGFESATWCININKAREM